MTHAEALLEAALELGYAPKVVRLLRGWIARPGDPDLKPYPSAPNALPEDMLEAHRVSLGELILIASEYEGYEYQPGEQRPAS